MYDPMDSHDLSGAFLDHWSEQEFLDKETEFGLIKRYKEGDKEAGKKIVSAFMHLVLKLVSSPKAKGKTRIPLRDLTQEGVLAIYNAMDTFDFEKGFRFSTHVNGYIQFRFKDMRLKNFANGSYGGVGGAMKKAIHFGPRMIMKEQSRLGRDLTNFEKAELIQKNTNVKNIADVERFLMDSGGFASLSQTLTTKTHGGEGSRLELQDLIRDETINVEDDVTEKVDRELITTYLANSFSVLNQREREIIGMVDLADTPTKFRDLKAKYGVSGERIRQIRFRGLAKIKAYLRQHAPEVHGLLVDEYGQGNTNLPIVDLYENRRKRRNNPSGFKGVSQTKNGKWQAYLYKAKGVKVNLGSYATPEEANRVLTNAKKQVISDLEDARRDNSTMQSRQKAYEDAI
jgi:RNA polymerase sigma factor (sigma-70 family)